jgi:transcription elongation factor SPT5
MAVALDGDQNPIRKNDKVKVIDGPFLSREGEVKHLYRGFCFIYNRKVSKNENKRFGASFDMSL